MASVKEMLVQLEALQKVDLRILELEREGAVHPKRLSELDGEQQTIRAAEAAERARIAENQKVRRGIEDEIQAERDKLKKWEVRLSEQQTTREYAALAREIDITRKHVTNLEEQLKEVATAAVALNAALAKREEELHKRLEASDAERATLNASIEMLAKQTEELVEKRTGLSQMVEPSLLTKYEAIRKKRGTGFVFVVNGTCRGCNMRIPPQLQNILRSGKTLETCPSCNRIICAAELLAPPAPQPTSN